MSEPGDGTDVYKLYAVVVHLDLLNASFYGHYNCYTKDFRGNWYKIDDCKVDLSLSLSYVCVCVCVCVMHSSCTHICVTTPSVRISPFYS